MIIQQLNLKLSGVENMFLKNELDNDPECYLDKRSKINLEVRRSNNKRKRDNVDNNNENNDNNNNNKENKTKDDANNDICNTLDEIKKDADLVELIYQNSGQIRNWSTLEKIQQIKNNIFTELPNKSSQYKSLWIIGESHCGKTYMALSLNHDSTKCCDTDRDKLLIKNIHRNCLIIDSGKFDFRRYNDFEYEYCTNELDNVYYNSKNNNIEINRSTKSRDSKNNNDYGEGTSMRKRHRI
ncbi:1475_t:CDS:2 [Scutellospora calospora]|uniref:1475_t:CDS:1 n=1 Tax=Scutellospora calospora TaxID=85575 RepID=A0ACA9JUV1_9GLOM|nr:1475_t:CDS:2 [Scutellospora calospora]